MDHGVEKKLAFEHQKYIINQPFCTQFYGSKMSLTVLFALSIQQLTGVILLLKLSNCCTVLLVLTRTRRTDSLIAVVNGALAEDQP